MFEKFDDGVHDPRVSAARTAIGVRTDRAVDYKGTRLLSKFKIDVLVEKRLVLELKAVESIRPVHKAQVISYLKLTGYPAGLLINFHEPTLKAGLHRLDHPDRYAMRKRINPG